MLDIQLDTQVWFGNPASVQISDLATTKCNACIHANKRCEKRTHFMLRYEYKPTKRIRVTKHSLQVHLLFAVRAHLFLSHNAPSSYAELVEPGFGVKAWYSSKGARV